MTIEKYDIHCQNTALFPLRQILYIMFIVDGLCQKCVINDKNNAFNKLLTKI